jgi:CheY-like chemotaxis protein
MVVGEWPLPQAEFEPLAREAGYQVSHVPAKGNPGYRRALVALLNQRPSLVILGRSWYTGGLKGIGGLIENLRGEKSLNDVPVLASVSESHDVAIREAFRRGCDDILPLHPEHMAEKLHALLPGAVPPEAPPQDKTLLVVDGILLHRTMFGRLLQNAGYQAQSAGSEEEAREALAKGPADLALLDLSLPGDPFSFARELEGKGIRVVGLGSPVEAVRPRAEEAGVQLFFDKLAPAEDLLFLLNDLLSPMPVVKRHSPRRLWSEVVRFGQNRLGLAYNLNRSGIYIRTLTPPKTGEQIRISTPYRVPDQRLGGLIRVSWVKPYIARSAQTYPPGFGGAFEALTDAETEAWEREYTALLSEGGQA